MTRQSRRDAATWRAAQKRDVYDYWAPLEPLTPALINQLVSRGWDRRQVETLAADGWKYNRKRDSLMQTGEFHAGK